MSKHWKEQFDFSGGVIDPRLIRRTDIPTYQNALKKGRNVLIRPDGIARRRPGSALVLRVEEFSIGGITPPGPDPGTDTLYTMPNAQQVDPKELDPILSDPDITVWFYNDVPKVTGSGYVPGETVAGQENIYTIVRADLPASIQINNVRAALRLKQVAGADAQMGVNLQSSNDGGTTWVGDNAPENAVYLPANQPITDQLTEVEWQFDVASPITADALRIIFVSAADAPNDFPGVADFVWNEVVTPPTDVLPTPTVTMPESTYPTPGDLIPPDPVNGPFNESTIFTNNGIDNQATYEIVHLDYGVAVRHSRIRFDGLLGKRIGVTFDWMPYCWLEVSTDNIAWTKVSKVWSNKLDFDPDLDWNTKFGFFIWDGDLSGLFPSGYRYARLVRYNTDAGGDIGAVVVGLTNIIAQGMAV